MFLSRSAAWALSLPMTISNPLLVGLIGRKRSGKDSFARVLVEEHGYARIAFADPLREAALALDPLVGRPALPGALAPGHDVRLSEVIDALGWEAAKDIAPEVRRILQRLGSEAIRSLDPTFWIRAAMREVEFSQSAGTPVVITDVRYRNEADEIRARGGVLLRIARPTDSLTDLAAPEHVSETDLDDYPDDSLVLNDGTLEDLQGMARYFGATFA